MPAGHRFERIRTFRFQDAYSLNLHLISLFTLFFFFFIAGTNSGSMARTDFMAPEERKMFL